MKRYCSRLQDFDLELSVTGDSEGSVSLHYAAYHGRVDIVKLLVSRNPTILAHTNYKGENALHVAVKRKQSDVMTVLGDMLETLGIEFCNQVMRQAKDENGNTVAQLILTSKSQVPGVFETYTQNSRDEGASTGNNEMNMDLFVREAMIVIGVLIATVTFQALMSPPQSLLKEGIANRNSSRAAVLFLSTNSVGFLTSSLSIIFYSMKESVIMLYFWVGASFLCTVISYICVLMSTMKDDEVFFTVFRTSIIMALPNLIISLYFSSPEVKNFVNKIIECLKS
ncbi:uncharacterized protein LOC110707132 [Chenopodium quinoa]|uniref:uncharacterized protein LOC110707132 n=1 Tax=Chenopodium quinoa TaxID=63459 RepID=UPI000B79976A|nr:uncharacterized protein LOC110707132 [Chenopodium quinoa]